jgi:hypothetical protein
LDLSRVDRFVGLSVDRSNGYFDQPTNRRPHHSFTTTRSNLGAKRWLTMNAMTYAVLQKPKMIAYAAGSPALASHFDRRVARWARAPSVQGDSSRRELVSTLTHINETPLTIAAAATYDVGRHVVSYAHSHRRTKLDRALLGVHAMPDGRGGVLVMVDAQR